MNYETIKVKRKDNVGIITFNRTEKENRINYKMVNEMSEALRELGEDEGVRALVINAEGKDFCCGWDPMEEILDKSALDIIDFARAATAMQKKIYDFIKPVVIAVHGRAVATGAEIAAIGDITIMADDAEIGFVAINAGLSCLPYIHDLRQIVGAKKALELILTGRILSGKEAERIGLVTKIVPRTKLLDSALQAASELANKSPLAVAFTKRANAAIRDMSSTDAAKRKNSCSKESFRRVWS